ncbi:hypothetical protein [Methylococcus capsulatus]|jgi:hypothetical protein|uniref:Uncharacterized protein n=1 Tax=Methylococcus capsulatus (strain ATCC 33009 / NCIMB 11132 / Bath) TaxID=243233 RepID=Q608A9_METCA|nr:hypothetical protein [Methylococcus capsulatus]AAU92124.1 hypothetical protein MCA1588 [Methylococcus capsulatus str. Bath]QXP92525.1 hypothetical protein KW113_08950 [Methylococcus capsulatus]UQN12750.1 hypothetical protein M3M30_02540 [Methylococcus capsulatus]
MTPVSKDQGVAVALLTEFTTHRLPRALDIRAKVERKEPLDDLDIGFLREVFETAQLIKSQVDRQPEYQEIYARAVALYKEIMDQAMANERERAEPASRL